MNLKTVSALLKRHQADLRQRGVKSLAAFGSLARGEATSSSDIDLLVEFDRPVGLFEFIRLKLYLEELPAEAWTWLPRTPSARPCALIF
jgi:predicted nucleotidyltransferase